MTSDNNVYVKDISPSGKVTYRPFGVRYDEKYLPDGIYYIHHTPYCSSTTNVDHYINGLYKIGDAKIPDLPQLCGLHTYVDYLFHEEAIEKIMNNNSYTWTELMAAIVSAIFSLNKTIIDNDKKRTDK